MFYKSSNISYSFWRWGFNPAWCRTKISCFLLAGNEFPVPKKLSILT